MVVATLQLRLYDDNEKVYVGSIDVIHTCYLRQPIKQSDIAVYNRLPFFDHETLT